MGKRKDKIKSGEHKNKFINAPRGPKVKSKKKKSK